MEIALISHLFPNRHNTAQGIFVHDEAAMLQKYVKLHLFIPSVYTFQKGSKRALKYKNHISTLFPKTNFRYISFPQKKFPKIIRWNLSRNLAPYIDELQPDLIHFHWLYPDGLAIPEMVKRNYPTLLTIHGSDWYKTRNSKSQKEVTKTSLESVNRILTVGQKLKNDILKEYPHLDEKIFVVPNGINADFFTPPRDKSKAKEKLQWNDKQIHLLCVSNLTHEKGIDILIRAISAFPVLKNTKVHIIASNADPKYENSIRKLIQKNKLTNIQFYPTQSRHQLLEYYQAADLFILPSRKEGFGLALAEAASCGVPVISTKSGGPEQIINASVGKIIEPDNPNILGRTMINIIKNLSPYHQDKMHKDIASRFGIENTVQIIIKHYRAIIEENAKV